MKTLLILFFSFFISLVLANDTLSLFYTINASAMSKNQMKQIETFTKGKHIEKVEIYGYADYLGTPEKNQVLSQSRADQVKLYFQKRNIFVVSATGGGSIGEVLESSEGIQQNRRVDLIFYFSDAESFGNNEESKDSMQAEILNLKVGDKFVLKNFNFIPGRHFLVAESKPELSKLIDVMKANPSLKIELHGHICCEIVKEDGYDIDEMNYSLSTNRAKYIYQKLIEFGVSADRMTYKGFGRSNPLFPNEHDEVEKNANRRVEILIVEK